MLMSGKNILTILEKGQGFPEVGRHLLSDLLWPAICLPTQEMQESRIPGNKLTQKDNADSGVKVITLAGPRQSLLLAKDPDKFL